MTSFLRRPKKQFFFSNIILQFGKDFIILNMGKIAAADKMRKHYVVCENLTACVAATGGHFEHLQ